MTIQKIATRLVELCRQGDFETCYKELYSPKIVSIESEGAPTPVAHGFEGIAEKGKKWETMVEQVHRTEIGEPIIAGNHFAITWKMNLTYKGAPEPIDSEEICLYEVEDGKIIKEQFFYAPMK